MNALERSLGSQLHTVQYVCQNGKLGHSWNGKLGHSWNGKLGHSWNGKLGDSCVRGTNGKLYDSQVRDHVIVHSGLNVNSSAHNCGCVVNGSDAMTAI